MKTTNDQKFETSDERGLPKVPLDTPNDKVVTSVENTSGGVRFDRVSDRRA